MKRYDRSCKEIYLEKSHTRELEKLKELQLRGRLDSQWLKEKFGEKYESSRESRRDEEKLEEIIMIRVTIEDQDSVVTSEEVVGESTPTTPKDVKYTTEPDTIWPPNATPR
jgi:hypothetical protein